MAHHFHRFRQATAAMQFQPWSRTARPCPRFPRATEVTHFRPSSPTAHRYRRFRQEMAATPSAHSPTFLIPKLTAPRACICARGFSIQKSSARQSTYDRLT